MHHIRFDRDCHIVDYRTSKQARFQYFHGNSSASRHQTLPFFGPPQTLNNRLEKNSVDFRTAGQAHPPPPSEYSNDFYRQNPTPYYKIYSHQTHSMHSTNATTRWTKRHISNVTLDWPTLSITSLNTMNNGTAGTVTSPSQRKNSSSRI